jgi:hypothetical protein
VSARRVALLAAVLSVAGARAGRAAEAAPGDARLRVLIVIDESDDPFAERIKAEVSALGLEVVAIEPWRTGESVESLDAAGRANQAAAAIRMIASRKGVEVWMANQPTGRSLIRQLVVDERPVPNDGLVALQTAELLRTTLLSRSEVPATSTSPSKNTPAGVAEIVPPPPPEPTSPPSASLQAAAGVLFSPGADLGMQVWVTASHLIAGPIGIAVDGSGPLRPTTISGPEGSANVSPWLGGAALFMRYDRPESRLYAIVAAGGAVIRLNAVTTTNPPLTATSGTATAGAIYARADGGLEANRWFRFGLRTIAGVVPQGVPVWFAGNEAAVWGRPFLAVMLLGDLSF